MDIALKLIICFIFFVLQNCYQGVNTSLAYEKILHKKLLDGYNPDVRPEPGHGEPVLVHFDVKVKKLISLDVRQQVFTLNAFTSLRWRDPQLSWNISDYDNIDYITIGNNFIWTPDIVLFNTADMESNAHTDYYKTKATILNTGYVVWTAPVTWKISCPFDVTWFPVDKQYCNLTFGSWTYTFTQIRIIPWNDHGLETIFHEHYMVESGEWKVNDIEVFYQNLTYSCCPEPYSTIVFSFQLSRLSLYYFMYILLPLISLAFLFLMVFFIPYNNGERMGFGVTVLLSITVYLLVISEQLPEKSDDKSMLGICFIIEFYLLCIALAMSLVTTNLSRRISTPPLWLLKLYALVHRKNAKDEAPINIDEVELEPLGKDENNDDLHNNTRTGRRAKLSKIQKLQHYEWHIIATFLDQCFFYICLSLMLIIPIIVTSSLNRKGLGS